MKGLCILGATGSIGVSTLDVVARHPKRYRVAALTANRNIDLLFEQCLTHRPEVVAIASAESAQRFQDKIQGTDLAGLTVLTGSDGLVQAATLSVVDAVMAAIVGGAGLLPTLAAAKAGKTILLANKEALVMSGDLFMDAIRQSGATLLPIDSEHNAIFQCMPGNYTAGHAAIGVRRILLTASGGPFRTTPLEQLASVTPAQAVAHPNWDMGQKISVDSATMMNKGLELIEACWLFDLSPEDVQIVIHPESVIHSMVDYVDGSVLAQMGTPDMRIPIAHALAWPERFASGAATLDLFKVARMNFEPPDLQRFPCLKLAIKAAELGGIVPAVLNAANEIAVAAFLQEKIGFTHIAKVIENTLAAIAPAPADNLEHILAVDHEARVKAQEFLHH
ncbi:MAG: 1-deoxy-D-xylulose-5-phosphate reductoisomerase [Methylococcales bacterium]|nr:1-deoxy-D-xylulose-5-phosphate reductoisomerase [Methylococcales bacterium]